MPNLSKTRHSLAVDRGIKFMKKRLLITSIVMMLVVAVALSTATYAWFTNSSSVTASSVTLSAATMDSAAIMISKADDNTGLSNLVSLDSLSNALYPATPNAAGTLTAASPTFANLEIQGDGSATVKSLPSNTQSFYTDTVYVYNKGASSATLTITINLAYGTAAADEEAAKSLRIAILEQVGSSTSNATAHASLASATLVGIYEIDTSTPAESPATGYTATMKAASDNYGIAGDGANKSQGSITFTGTGSHAVGTALSGNYICNAYTVIMWLEGWDAQCTNAASAGSFSVGLTFGVA